MKRFFLLLMTLCVATVVVAQEITPPKYEGAAVQRFMARMAGEFEKLALEAEIPASKLSPQVVIALEIGKDGTASGMRFMDNTREGHDRYDIAPATAETQELMQRVLVGLDKWTPAERNGEPVEYTCRMTLRLPVEKIAKKQNAEPLLFLGEDPATNFHQWATLRTHYDQRFTARGVEGLVHIRFYIEPDGKITIGEVVQSPDPKLSKEVIRVIKASRDRWAPRRVRGVPQRTAYDYRVDFSAN